MTRLRSSLFHLVRPAARICLLAASKAAARATSSVKFCLYCLLLLFNGVSYVIGLL
jgi:hypothetical protein